MAQLFLSYRRQDSASHAGRLFDFLSSRYGRDHVFLDIANIEPGIDWHQHITKAVEASDAVVAVIGPNWLGARSRTGQRRLDEPTDIVRLQIATALQLGKVLIPVLVGNAQMPAVDQLPADMAMLVTFHAVEINDESWNQDLGKLIVALERSLV